MNNDSDKVKDNRYICLSKRERNDSLDKCDNIGIGINKLNKLVQNIILVDFTDQFINNIDKSRSEKEIEERKTKIIELKNDYKKLENKESKLYDLYIDEMISKELHNIKFIEIKTEKEKIEKSIKVVDREINDINTTIENMSTIKSIHKDLMKGIKLDKTIVNKIISKIIITKTESDLFNSGSKVVKIEIVIGNKSLFYLLSQRTNEYIDLVTGEKKQLFNVPILTSFDLKKVKKIGTHNLSD